MDLFPTKKKKRRLAPRESSKTVFPDHNIDYVDEHKALKAAKILERYNRQNKKITGQQQPIARPHSTNSHQTSPYSDQQRYTPQEIRQPAPAPQPEQYPSQYPEAKEAEDEKWREEVAEKLAKLNRELEEKQDDDKPSDERLNNRLEILKTKWKDISYAFGLDTRKSDKSMMEKVKPHNLLKEAEKSNILSLARTGLDEKIYRDPLLANDYLRLFSRRTIDLILKLADYEATSKIFENQLEETIKTHNSEKRVVENYKKKLDEYGENLQIIMKSQAKKQREAFEQVITEQKDIRNKMAIALNAIAELAEKKNLRVEVKDEEEKDELDNPQSRTTNDDDLVPPPPDFGDGGSEEETNGEESEDESPDED